jgi:hypothetical protein
VARGILFLVGRSLFVRQHNYRYFLIQEAALRGVCTTREISFAQIRQMAKVRYRVVLPIGAGPLCDDVRRNLQDDADDDNQITKCYRKVA